MFALGMYNQEVPLLTAPDIVQHCSIAQPTVNHLDLALINLKLLNLSCDSTYLTYSEDYIYSHEKCRKVLSESRKILYTLHLDLPIGRERKIILCSRKSDNMSGDFRGFHLENVYLYESFYFDKLCEFLEYASNSVEYKEKLLQWFINFNVFSHLFRYMPNKIVNDFIDCMHPRFNASNFITECLKKVNFYRWVLLSEPNPERLRNILYQVCQVGRRSQCVHWIDEFLITCILHVSLKYVEEILKFINSPSLNQEFYSTVSAVVFSMRRTQNNSNLQNALRRRSLRRRTLLLHLFWNYLMLNLHTYTNEERAPVDVSVFYKGLRLFWDSVPDSFLSFEEIKTVFKESVDLKVIGDVASFYSKAIDEFHAVVEPRPLQHYCRTAIRRRLWERDQWLPEGIRKTRLPPKLQSYLNLNPI